MNPVRVTTETVKEVIYRYINECGENRFTIMCDVHFQRHIPIEKKAHLFFPQTFVHTIGTEQKRIAGMNDQINAMHSKIVFLIISNQAMFKRVVYLAVLLQWIGDAFLDQISQYSVITTQAAPATGRINPVNPAITNIQHDAVSPFEQNCRQSCGTSISTSLGIALT